MIIGEYPCCDGPLMIWLPPDCPKVEREICPHCGAAVWHYLARLNPQSWTEAAFLEEWEVDQETKSVKRKKKP